MDTDQNRQFECDADVSYDKCCSDVCMQRSIFTSDSISLHIPSWGGDGGNTPILLFPKTCPPLPLAAAAVSASKEEGHPKRRRSSAPECRALDMAHIPSLHDHRAIVSGVMMQQVIIPPRYLATFFLCSDLTLQPFAIVHTPNAISISAVRTLALPVTYLSRMRLSLSLIACT